MSGEVLIVQQYVPTYRAEFFRGLADRLGLDGLTLRLAVGRPDTTQAQRNDASGIARVEELASFSLRVGAKRLVIRALPHGWLSARALVLEHAVKHPDHFLMLIIRRIAGRPTLLWGHGHTITERPHRLLLLLQAAAIRLASGYLAYTAGSAERAVALGATSSKIFVLGNTLPGGPVTGALEKSAEGSWQALYIGGLDASKRIDELLSIGRSLHQARPEFRLLIAGDGELRDLVIEAQKEGWCDYIGRIGETEKARLAGRVQIILNPGRVGLLAIDSFRMAAPIVTVANRLHAPEFEYLTENTSVVCADASDAVASAIDLMNQPERLRALQANAFQESDRYTLAAMIESFAEGVTKTLKRQVPPG